MLRLSIAAYVAKVCQVLGLQGPLLVAGYYYSAQSTGELKFALTIGTLLLGLASAVNAINVAVFSRRFDRDEHETWDAARYQIALFSVISGVLAALVALSAVELLDVVAKGEYAGALAATALCAAGAALHGLIGVIVSTVYIPVGEYGRFVAAFLLAALVAVAGSLAASVAGLEIAWSAAAFLGGTAAGAMLTLAGLTRRFALPRRELAVLVMTIGMAVFAATGPPGGVRYALITLAILAGVATMRGQAGVRAS
jgi:O-antigen/teichoic acid export membrane protein